MYRHVLLALTLLTAAVPNLDAQDAVATDQGKANATRNATLFDAQGEYLGQCAHGLAEGWSNPTIGAQLIALTDKDGREKLRMVLYSGGLPGAGWTRNDPRLQVETTFANGTANYEGASFEGNWAATLRDGILSLRSAKGEALGDLKKVTRKSPTLGAAPPPRSVVLFDGSSADQFAKGRLTKAGLLAAGCDSKRAFADHRIHLEFKTPFKPQARGQGRGNSGVYVQGRYECQVLDSFGLDGLQNECGGVYSIAQPIVNACLPPETWQTYDIVFTAAQFQDGKKVANGRMTVHLNGILVHDELALTHATTAHRRPEGIEPGGLFLQDHGNPVVYRNIWVVENDPKRTRNIVFLAGRRSHGYASHEHRAGCMLLAKALDESDLNLTTKVISIWPEDTSVFDDADVIVSFADGGGGHPFMRHMGEIHGLMARGVGLVCLHYAVEVPTGKPGQNFLRWLGGYFETHWSVNPHWTANFTEFPKHAITRGVQPFAINDEWYFHMRFRPGMEAVTPILSALAPEQTMRRKDGPHSGNPHVRAAVAAKHPQHVGWAYSRADGGRAFGFTGGHVHWNWAEDNFRKVVLNAICWCAHMDVPADGVASTTPDLKALQANQDNQPGERFDAAQVQRMLDSFAGKR